jgi:hypothetical protein
MAQTSTTIQPVTAHKSTITGTVISFAKTGTEYKIASSNTTTTPLGNLAQFDLITVTGTSNNNKTFTVKSATSSQVIVEEEVTTEAAGASFTLDYVGFVTDKNKGDGYYSQVDGVHTVAYHVNSTMTGSIKMQGSLATTPTEDDWFNISGTTFTADQSTLVDSKNFTGNFVWVRAKCTAMTAGSVSKILYNH